MGQYSTNGISGNVAYKRRHTDADSGVDSFAPVTVSGGATPHPARSGPTART
ncbi:hypothetical protein U9R90_10835 [Streptomyces sp. E11-3]|uniref:hypothetical protein n=1 Tax=Streptomyces sp. E11-3 TaxID=3110112 RepID=UPI00397F7DA6